MTSAWPSEVELTNGQLHIHASDVHSDDPRVELAPLCQIALDTLSAQGVRSGHIDLIIIDADEITTLNREHMGQTGPTDVLSFPLDGPAVALDLLESSRGGVPGQPAADTSPNVPNLTQLGGGSPPVHLGDLVISAVIARRQADGHTGSEAAEFALLTIHGVLHILGHDHAEPEETERMQDIERTQLNELGFKHPVPR